MRPTRRQHALGCLSVSLLLVLPMPAEANQNAPHHRAQTPRIRPDGSRAADTLQPGRAFSPTLRALVERLEQSDLIVSIAIERRAAGHSDASIRFTHATAESRFLRISVNTDLKLPQRIVLLGHELQHALEVATNSEIRDGESFAQHYARVGVRKRRLFFDTQAALLAGERIRQELARTLPPVQRD